MLIGIFNLALCFTTVRRGVFGVTSWAVVAYALVLGVVLV
jgi:hypothetical protein